MEYGLTSALSDRLHKDFWARYEMHSVLDNDTRDTLETLRQRGMKLAVITNGSTEWQQRKLNALGIASWFDAVLISETEGVRKPNPEIFHRALARCNVDASATLFVGDHPDADIGGALGAGLRAVWKAVPYWPCTHDVVSIRQLSEILSMCPSGAADQRLLNDQVAYYRGRAAEYDQWFLREGRYDRGPQHRAEWFSEVETVKEALTATMKALDVLELACGTGLWTGQLTVLHSAADPASDNKECSYLINNASIVLKLQIGTSSFLFTGDANGKERTQANANLVGHVEGALLQLEAKVPGTLKVDVLKVPHHGSETANTIPFIEKTDPQFVIISASTSHHLPKETVVHRYESPTRVILRTDDHHPNNEDHILCIKKVGVPMDCNYETVFVE